MHEMRDEIEDGTIDDAAKRLERIFAKAETTLAASKPNSNVWH